MLPELGRASSNGGCAGRSSAGGITVRREVNRMADGPIRNRRRDPNARRVALNGRYRHPGSGPSDPISGHRDRESGCGVLRVRDVDSRAGKAELKRRLAIRGSGGLSRFSGAPAGIRRALRQVGSEAAGIRFDSTGTGFGSSPIGIDSFRIGIDPGRACFGPSALERRRRAAGQQKCSTEHPSCSTEQFRPLFGFG